MRFFNAFQMVVLFAAAPFGISWLSEQGFKGASAAFWGAIVAEFVLMCFLVGLVKMGLDAADK